MRGAFGIAAVAALLAGTGCKNSCQDICGRMADYAAEDCGFTVPDAEIDACVERMGQALEPEDRKACRDFGDPDVIRSQWSCEEMANYWSPDAA
jgi:hypothetical protein